VFVNGSNDYHAPGFRNPFNYLFKPSTPIPGKALDTEQLLNGLEKGWLNLNNRNGELRIKGTRIGFVGLDDPHDQLAQYDSISPPRGTDLLIGVAHAPYRRVIEEMGDCAIIFAGHTHGGQVCLPGGRAIVTNCDLPAKNARGLSGWSTAKGETILNVCAGLGTSIFAPVRLFCRPEVRILTLLPKA
jgi:predicted MPP superfamily phosphohydrolase